VLEIFRFRDCFPCVLPGSRSCTAGVFWKSNFGELMSCQAVLISLQGWAERSTHSGTKHDDRDRSGFSYLLIVFFVAFLHAVLSYRIVCHLYCAVCVGLGFAVGMVRGTDTRWPKARDESVGEQKGAGTCMLVLRCWCSHVGYLQFRLLFQRHCFLCAFVW
jgi:hypothetical protein